MKTLYLILAGAIGGLIGSMGLGGGTLLMPILTFCLKVSPKMASWINLVCFLPTAAVALVIHANNKMLEKGAVIYLLAFSFLGLALALPLLGRLPEVVLKKSFGWFLVLLGSISLIALFIGYFKENKQK